jgi:hypothetical protein
MSKETRPNEVGRVLKPEFNNSISEILAIESD